MAEINFPIDLSHRDYDLTGPGGNAFAVMGFVTSVIRQVGKNNEVPGKEIDKICEEYRIKATSGNYDNLIAVSREYVDINFVLDYDEENY